jgi:hypothetical protein
VFGALLAMFFGIDVTFGAGFVAYAVAALALVLIVRGLVRDGTTGDEEETAPPPDAKRAADEEGDERTPALVGDGPVRPASG